MNGCKALAPIVAAVAVGAGAAGHWIAQPSAGGPFTPNPPGACHARGALTDPTCTPGALNADVTQATIGQTICVRGWTATIRPSASVTGPEKRASMVAYGDGTDTGSFEYDHLISLELGGAPNDNSNLWPEPHVFAGPQGQDQGSFVKDKIENLLKHEICRGVVSLAAAQYWISHDWTAVSPGPLTVP